VIQPAFKMSAVDALSNTLATTNINDTPNTNGTPAASQPTDAAAASADEGRRLYIGNLAYATTEEELKDFFKEYTM
jgi:RNA recognition motif-containing protein